MIKNNGFQGTIKFGELTSKDKREYSYEGQGIIDRPSMTRSKPDLSVP